MQPCSLLLPIALVGCASVPRTGVHTLVDGPVHVSGIRGGWLQISNHGPGQLGYEYQTDGGTRAQGELGVGALLELEARLVPELWLFPILGESSRVSLWVDAGEVVRLTREARRVRR
jgi:hypothetical protein